MITARHRRTAATRRLLAIVAGAVCLAWLAAPGSYADDASLTAAFTPSSAEGSTGRPASAVLQLSSGAEAISNMSVSFAQPDSLKTEYDQPAPSLEANSSTSVVVEITRELGSSPTVSIQAIVTYTVEAKRRTTIAGISLTVPEATSPAPPLKVTTSLGTATLLQYQSTDLFFYVTNVSANEQAISSLKVGYPDGLTPARVGGTEVPKDGVLQIGEVPALGPGDGMVLHIRVKADKPVQPGTALMALTAVATDAVTSEVSTAFATQSITVNVLGESSVLSVLALPSLLLVPGLVLVVVLWMLWTYVSPRTPFAIAGTSGVEAKVVLWVFAGLPSLVFPFIYPYVTEWFGVRRDYRTAYGLDDILFLWIMAACFAVVVWLTVLLLRAVWRRWITILPGDPPVRVLNKTRFHPLQWKMTPRTAAYKGERVAILRETIATVTVGPIITIRAPKLSAEQLRSLDIARRNSWKLWLFRLRHSGELTLAYKRDSQPGLAERDQLSSFSSDHLVEIR